MPAPVVRRGPQAAEKWARRVAGATQDYESGIKSASGHWQPAAKAAGNTWKTAVTAAAGRDAYAKGVDRVGDAKWQEKTVAKGPARYGPGAAAATGDYQKAVGPYFDVIGRTDIPSRGPRGADNNYSRSANIGRALHQFKTSRG